MVNKDLFKLERSNEKAFTLVELIVVVTILALLSTIGFVSYSSYLTGVRDTNRLSQLVAISDGLELYRTKKTLPIPDDNIEVKAKGEVIAYQGYAGINVLETIDYSKTGKDPKDKIHFSYYLTQDKKYYQLLAYLEEEENLETNNNLFQRTYADIDYTNRYPKVSGKKLGILINEDNIPIQEISTIKTAGEIDLELTDKDTKFTAIISDEKSYSYSGSILNNKVYGLSKPKTYHKKLDCPTGFINIPGDPAFNQASFCIMQYEASFHGITTNYNSDNVYPYLVNGDKGKVVSEVGNSPIGYMRQGAAIDECKELGDGYHLVTNNERMTIARNIELEGINWSGGSIGNGSIYTGRAHASAMGCNDTSTNEPTNNRYFSTTGHNNCDGRNILTLSNGVKIWDFVGNVSEHVNKANTLDGSGFNVGRTTVGGTDSSTSSDYDGIYLASDMDLYGSIFHYGKAQGMGSIGQAVGSPANVFQRGDTSFSMYSGIYALHVGYTATTTGSNSGFRCAYIK